MQSTTKNVLMKPTTIKLLHEFPDEAAMRFPEKTAVLTDEGALTYQQLVVQSCCLANWFLQQGIQRGDRLALCLPNGISIVVAIMAASRVGAIFFVIHPMTKPYHVQHMIADATPKLILTNRQRAEEGRLESYDQVRILEDIYEEAMMCNPTAPQFPGISYDPVCLIYTSGSTGKPKAVISSHANMVFAAWAIQQRLDYHETDIIGNFLPLAFDVGLYQIPLSFQVGATLALGQETQVGPDLLDTLKIWKITGLPAVPTLLSILVRLSKRYPQDLPNLRFVTNTGSHLPHSIIRDIQELYLDISAFVMFGLTECKRVSILLPSEYLVKPDSVGRPLPDTECLIVDSEGRVLPPGVEGELVVRGPHVMSGYWNAPEMTAKRFRTWGTSNEKVLFTGDTCSMDEEGYLFFRGRFDDIYKQGGFRISALEVEAAASDILGITQVAVLPPFDGHEAVLFATSEIKDSAYILEALRTKLEDYKIPPSIVILPEMPLTVNGKVDKKILKELFQKGVYLP